MAERTAKSALFLAISLAAGSAPVGQARAQALPTWDIAEICAHESAPGQCAAFEGGALNAVSASWPFLLDPIRQTCLGEARSSADRSWRLLAECLEGESLKAVDKAAVHTSKTPAEPVPPAATLTPPALQIEIPPAPELSAPKL